MPYGGQFERHADPFLFAGRVGPNDPLQLVPEAFERTGERRCLCRVSLRASLLGDARGSTRRLRSDRKSTRLNSSHGYISYAVFCLKKKKRTTTKKKTSTPAPYTPY